MVIVMDKKKFFINWLYLKGVKWIMIFLLIITTILSIKKCIIGFIITEIIAIICIIWMIKYKKSKKTIDK